MTTNNLDTEFWDSRYRESQTGWDVGTITTPLKTYFDQLENKDLKILIPGGGNSYEAEYLFKNGFNTIFIIDLAPSPIANLKKRIPEFPTDHLILGDFFEHKGQYDLIIEQTFFCAINPELRQAYAKKMHELLKPGGKLVGLLFKEPFEKDGPPFGGTESEYRSYFQNLFEFLHFEPAYNSILPRNGRELFISLKKKLSED